MATQKEKEIKKAKEKNEQVRNQLLAEYKSLKQKPYLQDVILLRQGVDGWYAFSEDAELLRHYGFTGTMPTGEMFVLLIQEDEDTLSNLLHRLNKTALFVQHN